MIKSTNIQNVEEVISKAINTSIVTELKDLFKLNSETQVAYSTDTKEFINKYWNLGNVEQNREQQSVIIKCDRNEIVNGSALSTMRPLKGNETIIMEDSGINARVSMTTIPVKASLRLEIFSKSENQIETVKTNILNSKAYGRDVMLHNGVYRFFLTPFIGAFFNAVNDMYNGIIQPPEDRNILDYIGNITNGKFTLMTDIHATKSEIGFKYLISNIVGKFTSNIVEDKPKYDKDNGYWVYEVEYEYEYNRPSTLELEYDYTVYGDILPNRFIPQVPNMITMNDTVDPNTLEVVELDKKINILGYHLHTFNKAYVTLPSWDIHRPLYTNKLQTRLFSVLISLEPDDRVNLFNLTDLVEIALEDNILKALKECEREFVFNYGQSIFHIELYRNRELVQGHSLYLTEDLDIVSREPLSLDGTYRVVFNMVTDTSILSSAALKRLETCGLVLNERYDLDKGNTIPYIIEKLMGKGEMYTVQTSHLIAASISTLYTD
jgi:hypothetical protein